MNGWPEAAPYPFVVVIPARCASVRLPNKPLLDIAGKPMLEWVYRRAQASGAQQVLIAAGDEAVVQCAREFGAEVRLTRADHPNGTARIAEVAAEMEWSLETVVVNVQGDEPLMDPSFITQVARNLYTRPQMFAASLCAPLREGEWAKREVVKVWCDAQGVAQGFARQVETERQERCDRHLGIYAYRVDGLLAYAQLPEVPEEKAESLEQLRLLSHNLPIHVERVVQDSSRPATIGVDTAEDLAQARQLMEQALS